MLNAVNRACCQSSNAFSQNSAGVDSAIVLASCDYHLSIQTTWPNNAWF